MRNIRKVEIVKMENYPSFGIIATVKFLDNKLPAVGDVLEFEEERYSINGIVISKQAKLLIKVCLTAYMIAD